MNAVSGSSSRSPRIWISLLFLATTLGVARVQPRLAATTAAIKLREDVYLAPPPAELRAATLGYIAAATDLLWAKLLVEYGVHWVEHRSFPDLNHYLDALLALDPKYKPFYEYVDTMLVYRPVHGTEEDARTARAYLEQGIAALPYDPDVWSHYGQFIAFLAPSFLATEPERDRWREEGAFALTHAVELGANIDMTLSATTMLGRRYGERDAAIHALTRAYALTEDDAIRAEISAKLEVLQGSQERDQAEEVIQWIESQWRRDLPFMPRGEYLLLGPIDDPATCAGPSSATRAQCATSWDQATMPSR
jgi:tetratricopeptide (TPR) repeat protein